jgi:hypothetical protein
MKPKDISDAFKARDEEGRPITAAEIRQKAKKRDIAYNGSLTHFMRSLYNNTVKEQGFAVSVIETDEPVPESVLAELLNNPAVKLARSVKFTNG